MDTDPLPVRKKFVQMELDMTLAMFRAGVPFMAGTDTAAGVHIFPGFSLHQELVLFQRAGLTPMQALQTATLNPAKFMGRTADLGTVEKGKLADLVLLDANPLEDIANTQKIRGVVLAGRYFDRPALDRMLRGRGEGRGRRACSRREHGGYAMTAHRSRAAAAALAGCLMMLGLGAAADLEAKPVTVADLLAGSPAADWRVPSPEDTLYLELPHGRVVIELATRAVPQHAANIKALARAHYFDGLAIIRVQDNYVVQWDDESHRRADAGRRAPVGRVHRRCARRGAFRALAGPRSLCAGGRISGRISRRARSAHAHGVARALLRHGGRRPRRSAGEHRRGDVCGDRPCAAAARPQRRAGRTGLEGHGTSLDAAARQRRDGLLRRLGTAGAHHARCGSPSDVPEAERTPIEVLRTDSATFRSVLAQRRERHEPWFKHNPGAHRSLQRAAAGTRDPRGEPLSRARARRPPPDRAPGGGRRSYLNL